VAHAKDEDNELVVVDLVHDPVVAGTDPPLARATDEPGRGWWPGIDSEQLNGGLEASPHLRVELAELARGLLVLVVLAGLLAASVSAFSMALALSSGGEIQGFAAIMNGLNLPVLLLGGVLLPLGIGPLWLRVLGHFDPLYYLVNAARTLAEGHLATTATWQAFAVLVPVCTLSITWATRTYRTAVA